MFEENVGTLWSGNVLTFLDVNVFQDSNLDELDNGLFMSNVITWLTADLDADPTPASSPGTVALFAFGAMLIVMRRKSI